MHMKEKFLLENRRRVKQTKDTCQNNSEFQTGLAKWRLLDAISWRCGWYAWSKGSPHRGAGKSPLTNWHLAPFEFPTENWSGMKKIGWWCLRTWRYVYFLYISQLTTKFKIDDNDLEYLVGFSRSRLMMSHNITELMLWPHTFTSSSNCTSLWFPATTSTCSPS